MAVAAGAGAYRQVLYHQVSDGRTVEDPESGPDPAGGDAVSGEEPGGRTHLLLPGAGQLGEVVRVQRRGEVPGAGTCQAQGDYRRRRWGHPVFYCCDHFIGLCRKNLQ